MSSKQAGVGGEFRLCVKQASKQGRGGDAIGINMCCCHDLQYFYCNLGVLNTSPCASPFEKGDI